VISNPDLYCRLYNLVYIKKIGYQNIEYRIQNMEDYTNFQIIQTNGAINESLEGIKWRCGKQQ